MATALWKTGKKTTVTVGPLEGGGQTDTPFPKGWESTTRRLLAQVPSMSQSTPLQALICRLARGGRTPIARYRRDQFGPAVAILAIKGNLTVNLSRGNQSKGSHPIGPAEALRVMQGTALTLTGAARYKYAHEVTYDGEETGIAVIIRTVCPPPPPRRVEWVRAANQPTGPSTATGSTKEEFLVPVEVGGHRTAALMDTGATCCLANYNWCRSWGAKISPPSKNVAGAGGDSLRVVGETTVAVRLAPGPFRWRIKVTVVDRLCHPLILGTPFLKGRGALDLIAQPWKCYLVSGDRSTAIEVVPLPPPVPHVVAAASIKPPRAYQHPAAAAHTFVDFDAGVESITCPLARAVVKDFRHLWPDRNLVPPNKGWIGPFVRGR